MADYKSLILSNSFQQYRKQQLTAIVEQVRDILKDEMYGKSSNQKLQGSLEMANKIIKLPLKLIKDNDVQDKLNKQILEDLIGISTSLVREYINEE